MTIHYDFEDDDFEYEVEHFQLHSVINELLKKLSKKELIELLQDNDGEVLNLYEYFEEELREYFEDAAYERYYDYKSYRQNPLSYFGMSQRDFL